MTALSEKAGVKAMLLRLQGKDVTAFLGLVELCDLLREWHEEYVILSWNPRTEQLARLEANNGKGVVRLDKHNPVWSVTHQLLRRQHALADLVGPSWRLFIICTADYSLSFIGNQRGSEGDGVGRELFPEPKILL